MDNTVIGANVKKHRENLGVSQAQLADQLGYSAQTVSRLERGAVADITVNKLIQVADALAVDINDLLEGAA